MNNSKKSHDLVRQNEKNVQKSQKHDANLQKNSTLYFQVGLILCLLASYGALEMSFQDNASFYEPTKKEVEDEFVYVMPDFVIEKKVQPEEFKEIPKTKAKAPDIEIVDNNKKVEEVLKDIIKQEIPDNKKPVLSTDDPSLNIDEIPEKIYPIAVVQMVPIYPGCEKKTNNLDRKKCMSDKLSKLIQKKFDRDLPSDLGLTGKQNIYVSFKINKSGEVEILGTKANHKELEKEANRVVGKIPTMKPGQNDNKPVEVSYMLPIKFNIQ